MSFFKGVPAAASGKKLAGLDHLRALAITLVFLYHYLLFDHPDWMNDVSDFGWTGVDLFFVLSGFLIAGQLFKSLQQENRLPLKTFYLKRSFRILPAYLFILTLYFSIPGFKERPGLSPLWKFLTFTQNFGLDLRTTHAFTHAWSLCIEEQFYLLLPFILLLFVRLNKLAAARYLLLFFFVGGFLIRAYSWVHFVQPLQGGNGMYAVWYKYIYYPTYSRLDGLLTGVFLAAVFQYRPAIRERINTWSNWLLLLGGALITGAYFLCATPSSLGASVFGFPLVALAFGFWVAAATSPSCILYRSTSKITRFIATLSYSIYLSHKAVIHLTQEGFARLNIERNSVLMFAICMVMAVLGGLLLHYIIEKPFLRWRDRLLKPAPANG